MGGCDRPAMRFLGRRRWTTWTALARIGTAEALRSSRLRLRAAARLEESDGARTLGSLAWVVPALRIESRKEHGFPSPARPEAGAGARCC